jgi:hypothetical protein
MNLFFRQSSDLDHSLLVHWIMICVQPAIGMNRAIAAIQNGILGSDDFLRHGLPPSPYQFSSVSGGLTIEQVCWAPCSPNLSPTGLDSSKGQCDVCLYSYVSNIVMWIPMQLCVRICDQWLII